MPTLAERNRILEILIDGSGVAQVLTAGGGLEPLADYIGSGSGAGLGANTFTAAQTAPDIIVSGLTGATASGRLVGFTASGSPSTGTFLAGDVVLSLGDAKWYTCTAGGSPGTWTTPSSGGSTSYAQAVLADSPVAYWRLGESSGTSAADSAGSNTGTYSGGYTLGAGGVTADGNKAVLLNGSTGKVTAASSAGLQVTNAFTLEMWIKPTAAALQMPLAKGSSASPDYEWRLDSSGAQELLHTGTTAGASLELVPTGKWSHIAITYDGAQVIYYLNGLGGIPFATVFSCTQSSGSVTIGVRSDGFGFIAGTIDEVAIYNTALGANRIRAHYLSA